nr:RHS repeat-associated core domain-containing protein [Fibrobacter succinogenes]
MLVYGTSAYNDTYFSGYKGGVQAAYDYRAFGEQVSLMEPADKVTETFTGKELDDETELNYFGARYLDPMLGLWTSVDPMREYHSPYIYLRGNPINLVDPTGMAEASDDIQSVSQDAYNYINNFKPTEKEISTFIETYDKFEGLTPKLLKGILENMYVQYEDNPRSETANGYYYPGDDREIYLTDRALNTKDSDWQMRIRSTIFHETAHYLNGLYGSINDGQKPYPDEKYQKKGFNGGSVELGKEFEYRAYGKDY